MDLLQQRCGIFIHFFMVNGRNEAEQFLYGVAAQENILSDRPCGYWLQLLMYHRNAHPERFHRVVDGDRITIEQDLTGIHLIDAEHTFHKCGFTGAVLAHQGVNRAGTEAELCVVQRLYAGEGLAHTAHLQQKLRHFECLQS